MNQESPKCGAIMWSMGLEFSCSVEAGKTYKKHVAWRKAESEGRSTWASIEWTTTPRGRATRTPPVEEKT